MTKARVAAAVLTAVVLSLATSGRVQAADDPVPKQLGNAVVSEEGGCPEGSADPDCVTTVGIESMKIVKAVDKTVAKPGERVTYTLTITNTGTVPLTGKSVTDDLSGVLDDATFRGLDTKGGAAEFAKPTLRWSGGLAVGGEAVVVYSVTVDDPPKGDLKLANAVTGPRGSNCAPGSGDPDCSPPPVRIPLLKIVKKGEPKRPRPGGTVNYTITVTNVGTAEYQGADLVDDLSKVLDDGAYNRDGSATTGRVGYTEPNLTWTGDVALNAPVTITYSITIDDPDLGDGRFDNAVVSNGPGTNCPRGSTDPDCDEHLPAPLYDWGDAPDDYPTERSKNGAHALIVDDLRIGATIESETDGEDHEDAAGDQGDDGTTTLPDLYLGESGFSLTAVKVHNATGHDAVLAGWIDFDRDFAFDPSELARVTVPSGDPEVDLNWSGATYGEPGETFMRLRLFGESSSARRADFDVRPTGFGGPGEVEDYRMEVLPAEVKIVKKAKVSKDTVTYTIKVTSTSPNEFAASFTDDLTRVLDDASYNGDATGGATYAEPVLSWKGTVPGGGEVTVTYSVTVDDPARGDGVLANVVVGKDSNCAKGSEDTACRTRTEVPPPPDKPGNPSNPGGDVLVRQELPFTGFPGMPLAVLGLLLILVGGLARRI
ncbi:DUF7507 domain-containing protein [Nonomuraea soli]|uniref:Putative repeat protein (TIGR01451 family) n=1 Tax=Nonomuraea soli TaxID=1032476 RepID=A0A7W0CIX6_9ACTN|nr:GEVED domain-containing protein [Nonomuraea soli]MBA2892033.1 putative repeat protein (TIGR01451 family) [Nonomuraea soli]